MAESVAIPSVQTLVQVSKCIQNFFGQLFLGDLVVTITDLLADFRLSRPFVPDDDTPLSGLSVRGWRADPGLLNVVSSVTDTSFVALTCIKTTALSRKFTKSYPYRPKPRHHSRLVTAAIKALRLAGSDRSRQDRLEQTNARTARRVPRSASPLCDTSRVPLQTRWAGWQIISASVCCPALLLRETGGWSWFRIICVEGLPYAARGA